MTASQPGPASSNRPREDQHTRATTGDTHPAPYGARERADLATLDNELRAADPVIRTEVAPGVADLLRKALPDIDDTTIGRVLIALSTPGSAFLRAVIRNEQPEAQAALSRLWATLAGAGLDLTATAWQPHQDPAAEPEL
jgi:hypothetical protein